MTTNLTIDTGNSWVKTAVFGSDKLIATQRHKALDSSTLQEIIGKYAVSSIIESNVAKASSEIEDTAQKLGTRYLRLSHSTPLPISIGYGTPLTLGTDRIATATGAWQLAKGKATMVVDAGTAITIDIITADGTFAGGNIAPGVSMRLQALHQHTSRLPLVSATGDTPLVGHDTETALRSGAVTGAALEIDGMAQRLQSQLGELKVIITGGDAQLLMGHLSCQATLRENLLAEGLNRILLYNERNI